MFADAMFAGVSILGYALGWPKADTNGAITAFPVGVAYELGIYRG